MKKKIIINARFLTQPITGVQRFAIEICRELKKLDPSIIFVSPKNIIHAELAKEFNVKVIGNFRGHFWEQIELRMFIYRNKALLISLCNSAPLFLDNQIITIHDICFKKHPEWFSFIFATYYNFIIPRLIKNAEHILTVSEFSKSEIIKEYKIQEGKISVIYNALPAFFQQDFKVNDNINSLSKERYILTVSSQNPRKNFKRLIQGFKMINDKNLKLYIIGNSNKHFGNTDLSESILPNVFFLEKINDEELISYYRNASLFVFPSLYEGFGIPILEAISQNVSICVSDIPVFHEICKDEAIYFDPYNPKDICEKIQKALNNNKSISKNIIQRFNWNEGAVKIKKIISEL